MSTRMTLEEFLAARLDEDELAAFGVPAGPWHVGGDEIKGYPQSIFNAANILIAQTYTGPEVPPMEADYIARYDPARVLREVEAKRKILVIAQIATEETQKLLRTDPNPSAENPDAASAAAIVTTIGLVLVALGEIYSDHPDYQQEWKP